MNNKRGFLRAAVCAAVFVSTGVLSVVPNQALAACGTGGRCSVTNGTPESFSGGTYESIFWGSWGTALYAANPGSSINADNVTVKPSNAWPWSLFSANAEKVWAQNGGVINLTNADIFGGRYGLNAEGADSQITMTGGRINVRDRAAQARGTSSLFFNGGVVIETTDDYSTGIDIGEDASVRLDNSTINATGRLSWSAYGADRARLAFTESSVKASGEYARGAFGIGNAEFALHRTNIAVSGDYSYGVALSDSARFDSLESVIGVTGFNSTAVYGQMNAGFDFEGTDITASGDMSTALALSGDARANFRNGIIKATGDNSWGVNILEGGTLFLEDASLSVEGASAAAIYFENWSSLPTYSAVDIANSRVSTSPQATAIVSRGSSPHHNMFYLTNSEMSGGDKLIDVRDTSGLNFFAHNSLLSGHTSVDMGAYSSMSLQDSSWIVQHDGSGAGNSSVSRLEFANSTIRFDSPVGGVYQSLRVGAGSLSTSDVYQAASNSFLEINTLINSGGGLANQSTDRLLIEGDVSGQTVMKIHEMVGSNGESTSLFGTNAAHEGISLVQVSGQAQPDSFVLEGGYITLNGSPYTHKLYAFGSGSAYGAADSGQQLVGGIDHWDYRLQNEFIRSGHGWARQVVPQVASYLTAPTALFQAGFMDVSSLQNRLGELRHTAAITVDESESDEQPTKMRGDFFLRGYGGDYNYHSDLSSVRYGYDADIRYAAVQAGGSVYGFETAAGEMMFGLAGSYGDLSFSPERLDSRKTSMDVWSASAYGSWLGNNGLYVDTILSYGGFSGTVSTRRHDRTAKLKGHSLTASVEVGQNFALGTDGWSIEPQAQLIYQRLSFDQAYDVDGFAVALGNPDQWVGRIGGKLSKEVAMESVERLVLYGKLNLIHGFDDGDRVFLGDNFRLGEFGTQIEGGVGLNLDMTKNAALYGDVSYQGRVGDGGSNGFSLNGGLRFQF